jgi:ABC-type amino acid transport substrate-binding protein/nitrogen-specific signal transduction histidine kinase
MMRRLFLLFSLVTTLLVWSKELNIAFGYDKPPYTFSKDSSIGIEPELVKKAFEPYGYKVNVTQMSKYYLEKILFEENDLDGVSSVTPRDGDGLFYSDKFTYYENFVITRKRDHIKIDSLEDLAKIDFVSWNSSYNDLGDKFYRYFNPVDGIYRQRYHENPSQLEDAKMFFQGKVDAILVDKKIFKWFTTYLNIKDSFEYHGIFPKKKWYSMAFRSKKIRDVFNEGLKKLRESGEYDRIVEYYLNHDMTSILKLANVLSEMAAPYLYRLDDRTMKSIIEKFMKNDDIVSITILDSKLDRVFVKSVKKSNSVKTATFTKSIRYKAENTYVDLGEVIIEYKRDFDFHGNSPIPDIESFYTIPTIEIEKIRDIYKRSNIISGKPITLDKEELAYLKKLKFISVHNERMWAPYNFNINGKPQGLVVDFMKLLGRKLDLKIRFVSGYSWNEFLQLIKEGRIDVISNIVDTPDRREYIEFTKPYMISKKAIFSNQPGLKHFSDLEGKIVAVPKGFYIERYLKEKYPKIRLKTYRNVLSCIVAVINGEADAVVESYSVISYLMQKNDLKLKYMTLSEDSELQSHLCIGVAKDKKILRDILQKAIDSVSEDEMRQLRQKWLGIKEREVSIYDEEEYRYLKNTRKINICTNPNWRPIEFSENGNPKGISIDVLNILLNKIGIKPNFIHSDSWEESQEMMKRGECDILPAAVYTKERATYAYFTKPYLSYKVAIVTSEDKPVVTDFASVADKTMVRKKKSGLINIMKKRYPGLKVIEVDSYEEAFEKVRNNEAYFTTATLPILSYYQYTHGLNNLKVAGYLDLSYDLSIMVTRNNYLLYSIIDKTLSTIPQSTMRIINDRWTTFKVVKTIDYGLVLKIVSISLLIILIISIAYYKLRRLHRQIDEMNRTLENRVMEEVMKNRQKEKMMMFQDRLAKMGEIISMIAHQWRQPLNNISILNQVLLLKYRKGTLDDKAVENFSRETGKQIKLMSDTIDHFRDFFKPEKEMKDFNLGRLVEDMVDMIGPVLESHDIDISIDVEKDIVIKGYRNELGQSIISILNNARDALVAGRESDRKIRIEARRESGKAVLRIIDNGGGIPENILDKLCEPYFSTKESKNGTGIGLYMARMIVEEHMKGVLRFYNRESSAVFEIILNDDGSKGEEKSNCEEC